MLAADRFGVNEHWRFIHLPLSAADIAIRSSVAHPCTSEFSAVVTQFVTQSSRGVGLPVAHALPCRAAPAGSRWSAQPDERP